VEQQTCDGRMERSAPFGVNEHKKKGARSACVTNPTVYNRSIYKYNLIDVYKYNHMLL
jgi:hypothetical protein